MENRKGFEFLGFIAILSVGGFGISFLIAGKGGPSLINTLSNYLPSVTENANTLTYIVIAVLTLITIALPPLLMNDDRDRGTNKMKTAGLASFYAIAGVVGFALGGVLLSII